MKLKTVLLTLGLLLTTMQQGYAASAEAETHYRRGPSLCARMAMIGGAVFSSLSGSHAETGTPNNNTSARIIMAESINSAAGNEDGYCQISCGGLKLDIYFLCFPENEENRWLSDTYKSFCPGFKPSESEERTRRELNQMVGGN